MSAMCAVADDIHAAFGRTLSDAATGRIVEIDHGVPQPRPLEQHCLGGLVSLHRFMDVEVVARQVGEQRHVEVHAVHATLLESDR